MAALRGNRLWRIPVADRTAGQPEAYFVGEYGRMRTVVTAPDGKLWVTTSNRDGRGSTLGRRRPDPGGQPDGRLTGVGLVYPGTRVNLTTGLLQRPDRHGLAEIPCVVPTTVARLAARRSVVSTAGPSRTIATALVIARPVSKSRSR